MSIKIVKFAVSKLTDEAAKAREVDADTVAEYAAAMKAGAEFPAVTVYDCGKERYLLADGWHRLEAAKAAGCKFIAATVVKGDENAAVIWSNKSNSSNGRRWTNEEKREKVLKAWRNRKRYGLGDNPSDRAVAEWADVSTTLVSSIVADLRVSDKPRTGVDGKARAVPTNQLQQMTVDSVPANQLKEFTVDSVPANQLKEFTVDSVPPNKYGASVKETLPPEPPEMPPEMPRSKPKKGAVDRLGRELPRGVLVDRFRRMVPMEIKPAFDGPSPIRPALENLYSARRMLVDGLKAKDIRFGAVRQDALIQLDNSIRWLVDAIPYAVCPVCQGQGCKACGGRGWQTKAQYDRNPAELREEEK